MLDSIRNRLIFIAVLIVASLISLYPRDVKTRVRGPDGAMRDTLIRAIPIKRGLDLQGGMHLALELDESQQVSADKPRDIELALQVLRKRIDEFGVTEPLIQKQGDERIVVELAGVTDPARAIDIVQQSAFLEFRITDETDALGKALPAMDRALRGLGVAAAPGGQAPGRSAVADLLGAADSATDSTRGDSAVALDSVLPVGGGAVLSSLIQPGGIPGEFLVRTASVPRVDSLLRLPEVAKLVPRSISLRWSYDTVSVAADSYTYLYALEDRPIITGSELVDANAQLDPLSNGPVVNFELSSKGGREFGNATGRHVGDYLAILLDNRVQGRPPVIQERIGRNGRISMYGRGMAEANDLALTLRAGALPVPLTIVERRQVGASLGNDSIRAGITAGLIGMVLVIIVMIGYYRVSGMLAVVALGMYVLFTLAGLAALGATLTLPGLAGLVLSVGIAVDANVLIFERIREELQGGKSVRLAVDEGFRHAMAAIVDSSVSTVLTALFLFQFGTGPVKGFAVTLIMGIAASLITAVFVTRTFFMLWLDRKPEMSTLSI